MIFVALGANLPSQAGAPAQTLKAALAAMESQGIAVEKLSAFYASEAWPDPSDPNFVNAVARVRTDLPPVALLGVLHAVESQFGRVRSRRNAPRALDLDLIDYDGRVQEGPPQLPHPRAASRAFVLLPLRDVAPGWIHPVTGETVSELMAALPPAAIERLPR